MNKHRRNRGRGGPRNSTPFPRKQVRKQIDEKYQLTEVEVGITEFINKDLKGFVGIIKARFSDFHVNEIDLDDNVAKLTNLQPPEEFLEKKIVPVDAPLESPISQISNDIWTSILELKNKEKTDETVSMKITDKEDRAMVHKTIKEIFGKNLVSNTVKKDDDLYVVLSQPDKNKPQEIRFEWPYENQYVHFLLYKEHIDTIQATMKLASALKMKSSSFTYAGVKDRRAKTTQWLCVRKVHPSKLIFRTNKYHTYLKVGNVKIEAEPLKLGHLKGNAFRIALRNVTVDDCVVNDCMEAVKKSGFVNYFGLQRFGADKTVPTHLVGTKLMQGNFKEACELILKVKDCDDPDDSITKAKKKYLESGDAKSALLYLLDGDNTSIEAKLLEGLAKCNANDYVTALESIARNMRLLYIHAFQSLIWNLATSKRINDFGLIPVIGDLVLVSEAIVKVEGEDEESDDVESTIQRQEVEAVTSDNISQYTIFDVVLPLPGFDVKYPENLRDYYKELLTEHGLSLEMPKQKVMTYTLSGNYRHIVQNATNITWTTLKYNDPNDTLIRSDFEEFLNKPEPISNPNGQFKSVVVSFHLPSASYATMCLREIMKIDTCTSTHAKMMDTQNGTDCSKGQVPDEIKPVPVEEAPQECSLLANKEKFEAFKRSIFAESAKDGDCLKRKLEEEAVVEEVKKARQDEDEDKTVIPMMQSMP